MQQNLADLISHLTQHAVRTDGPFTLRSGAVSDWYLDARQTTFSGRGAHLVGEVMLDFISADVAAVGGLTMGADPVALATAIAAAARHRSVVAFSIRKEAKDHGTGGRLVGPVEPGTNVAIVEDTTSTGGAMVEAVSAARDAGLVVLATVALIDRSDGLTEAAMNALDIPYRAVIVPADLGLS